MPPRATLYRLLSRLYRAAPDAEMLAALRGIPGFDDHLPSPADETAWLEEMAVAHHTLFGMTVYPYESLFRHSSLMVNDGTEAITTFYETCGYVPAVADVGAPDHLAVELDCMVLLDDYANRAMTEGRRAGAAWAEEQRGYLVLHHLAVWVPLFADAVIRATPAPIYETLVQVTQELVLWELSNCPAVPSPFPFPVPLSDMNGTKEKGETEEEDEVGLNSIVRTLITPARVGVWLSRADLRAIARPLQLPIGMGDRHTQLRTLFEAAGQFDALPALFEALEEQLQRAHTAFTALQTEYPAWQPIGKAWLAQLDAGRTLLTQLREQDSNFKSQAVETE